METLLFVIAPAVIAVIFFAHILRNAVQNHAVEITERILLKSFNGHALTNVLNNTHSKEDIIENAQEDLWQTCRSFSQIHTSFMSSENKEIKSSTVLNHMVRIVKLVHLLTHAHDGNIVRVDPETGQITKFK